MTIITILSVKAAQQARNQCAHGVMSALSCTVAQPGLSLKHCSGLSTWADTKLNIKCWRLCFKALNMHHCISLAAEICFHLFWEMPVVKLKMLDSLMEVQSNRDKSQHFFSTPLSEQATSFWTRAKKLTSRFAELHKHHILQSAQPCIDWGWNGGKREKRVAATCCSWWQRLYLWWHRLSHSSCSTRGEDCAACVAWPQSSCRQVSDEELPAARGLWGGNTARLWNQHLAHSQTLLQLQAVCTVHVFIWKWGERSLPSLWACKGCPWIWALWHQQLLECAQCQQSTAPPNNNPEAVLFH